MRSVDEEADNFLSRMNKAIVASPRAGTCSEKERTQEIVNGLARLSTRLSEFIGTGLSLLTITSLRIPGELRLERFEDSVTRTFSLYRGDVHVGSMLLDHYDSTSGFIGCGVRLMVSESAYLNEKAIKH